MPPQWRRLLGRELPRLKVRDFGHQWSIKQYGEQEAISEYKFKFMVFTSGYGMTFIFIIFQTMFYFFGSDILPIHKTDPWFIKLLAGSILIFFPIYLLSQYLLRKIEHIPIPMAYSQKEYRKSLFLYWAGFLFGYFLWIFVGIILMSYLRGQEINIFNIHLNEGGHIRTFEKDFGR